MASAEDQAWVTLATNDKYAIGALVLGQSLKRVVTTRKLAILITNAVTEDMRQVLGKLFDTVQMVDVLDSNDVANLALLTRPDLGVTFTKLHCWRLTQYTKCVFLDADTLIMQNCDEIFEREELSAAPDVGWPDCFNSGVFVYQPSLDTYLKLLRLALTAGSFDGGDQGLLNMYFDDWATKDIARHLPFIYNMTSSASYSYLPAYQTFGKNVKIVHFIGPVKPWLHRYNTQTGRVEPSPGSHHTLDHLQFWWDVFIHDVKPIMSGDLKEEERHHRLPNLSNPTVTAHASIAAGLAGQLALVTLGQEISSEQKALDDRARQFSWEQGQADYLGADAFANIQKKLDEALVTEAGSSPAPEDAAAEPPTAPVAVPEASTIALETVSAAPAAEPPAPAPETIAPAPEPPAPVLEPPAPAPETPAPAPQIPAEAALPPATQPQQPASPTADIKTVAIPPKPLDAGPIPPEPISPPPMLPPPPPHATPGTPPAAAGPPTLASPLAAAAASPAAPPTKPTKQKGKKPKSP